MIRLACTCVEFGIASEGLVLVVLYYGSSSNVRGRNSSSMTLDVRDHTQILSASFVTEGDLHCLASSR